MFCFLLFLGKKNVKPDQILDISNKSLIFGHLIVENSFISMKPEKINYFCSEKKKNKYKIPFGIDTKCKRLCSIKYSNEEINEIGDLINKNFRSSVKIDGIPSITKEEFKTYKNTFPIGSKVSLKTHVLSSHLMINVYTHSGAIQRVIATPTTSNNDPLCDEVLTDTIEDNSHITYSFSIHFIEEEASKKSREKYFLSKIKKPFNKWYSKSKIPLVSFTGLVCIFSVVLLKISNMISDETNVVRYEEEGTWKDISGDVFRPPKRIGILTIIVSGGVRYIVAFIFVFTFGKLGMISPFNDRTFKSFIYFNAFGCFVGSLLGGYIFKKMNGKQWFKQIFMMHFLPSLPIYVFTILVSYLTGDLIIPFSASKITFYEFFVFFPLSFLGALISFKLPVFVDIQKTNMIPRSIPNNGPIYSHFLLAVLMGLFVFSISIPHIQAILERVFQPYGINFAYGPLLCQLLELCFSSGIAAIAASIITFNNEDHNWWSLSVGTATSGIFILVYLLFNIVTNYKESDPQTKSILIISSVATSIVISIISGASGFISSLVFTYIIYSYI